MRSSRRGSSQRFGSSRPLWHRRRAASGLGPASLPYVRVRQPAPCRSRELAGAARPPPLRRAERRHETARRNPRLVSTQDRQHAQRDDPPRSRATNYVVRPGAPERARRPGRGATQRRLAPMHSRSWSFGVAVTGDPPRDRGLHDDHPATPVATRRQPATERAAFQESGKYLKNWPYQSGWRDSNPRPPAPKAGALTKLRYIPCL
jgi:hypothetical protein